MSLLRTTMFSVVDRGRPRLPGYQVFLTPDGDVRGPLYVSQKFAGGFTVREAQGGRSSIFFDYRIVAHRAGSSDARLPVIQSPQAPPLHFQRAPQ